MTEAAERRVFSIGNEQRTQFEGIVVLWMMIQKEEIIEIIGDEDSEILDPVMQELYNQRLVEIKKEGLLKDRQFWIVSEKGHQHLEKFMRRYTDFLKMIDIYCAVNLGDPPSDDPDEGPFAFERWFDFESEDAFGAYLDQERFQDLRVAVAIFKSMDPVEIVLMAFLNEGRLYCEEGWQWKLMTDEIWEEIIEICNSNFHPEDLGYDGPDGWISGEDVISEVIEVGTKVMIELLEEEARQQPDDDDDDDDDDDEYAEVYEEYYDPIVYVDPIGYWSPWYDPYYCPVYDPWYW